VITPIREAVEAARNSRNAMPTHKSTSNGHISGQPNHT